PCQVGAGMTGICRGSHATDAHLQAARQLFETVGRTVVVDEKHMDAVTGLSASGPAFVYIILESLAEAGVKVGLPRDVATLLAGADDEGFGERGSGNRRSSRAPKGRSHYPGRLHDRRHPRTRRRKTQSHAHQG